MNDAQDTQPLYDIYVEEDRVTFVRRPDEQIVESTTAQEPLRWVLLVMLGSHGLIAVLSLALIAYLTLVPAPVTVYALTDKLPSLASVHALPAVTMTKSQTVSTTGHVHVPATQARGLVVFYNSLTRPQVIDAGTLLVGSDGQEIVTDANAYVPAGNYASNGQATVPAHALNPGVEGNIRAGDISGPCCRAFIQAVNAEFTGGHDARDYSYVTQGDVNGARNSLLASITPVILAKLKSLLPLGHVFLTPIPCKTHMGSNYRVGAIANMVVVTLTQACTPTVYNPHDLQRSLASLIAGKTPGQARALLQAQGIKEAGIRLGWLHDRLPADPNQIHVVLLFN